MSWKVIITNIFQKINLHLAYFMEIINYIRSNLSEAESISTGKFFLIKQYSALARHSSYTEFAWGKIYHILRFSNIYFLYKILSLLIFFYWNCKYYVQIENTVAIIKKRTVNRTDNEMYGDYLRSDVSWKTIFPIIIILFNLKMLFSPLHLFFIYILIVNFDVIYANLCITKENSLIKLLIYINKI